MEDAVRELTEAIDKTSRGLVLFVTGAGVSLASGISTFRGTDEGAVWSHDLMELGTNAYFERDPVASWRWYIERFGGILEKKPNPAHHAIAALERWQIERGGRFLLITQNIDTLHEQAGSREMIKVHGTIDRVRCTRGGCRYGAPSGSLPRPEVDMESFLASLSRDTLPRCPECGALLRQHVLWFDEFYTGHADYEWGKVHEAVETAHLVVFVGTSLSVGVTDLVVRSCAFVGVPVLSIDPGTPDPPYPGIRMLREKSEELLPAVCEKLGVK